ncbi:uncharacterized protein A4U43_C05F12600 [Asparagus officinalis]|uniref:Uncharacterized protein n=1 Tax=Asparagus officinalis TaxID=4686 RepID=A0A5P1EVI6_ASPOF|nr:uncharacterized protein A4U43_C05F12600 [Asparagus officinalis]
MLASDPTLYLATFSPTSFRTPLVKINSTFLTEMFFLMRITESSWNLFLIDASLPSTPSCPRFELSPTARITPPAPERLATVSLHKPKPNGHSSFHLLPPVVRRTTRRLTSSPSYSSTQPPASELSRAQTEPHTPIAAPNPETTLLSSHVRQPPCRRPEPNSPNSDQRGHPCLNSDSHEPSTSLPQTTNPSATPPSQTLPRPPPHSSHPPQPPDIRHHPFQQPSR